MISFFRRIPKKMPDDNRPLKNMRYVIGEVVLVSIAIFIALNLNNWNENRKINRGEIEIISLKGDLSYSEICKQVSKNTFNDIKSFVKIKDGKNIKTIRLNSISQSCLLRNTLDVTKDSVYDYLVGTMPIKDLKIVLKKFYLDRGRGIIVIVLKRLLTPSKDLEDLLLNVTQEFDKMNCETVQSYDLIIYLNDIIPVRPPPPLE